jgi:hypothetical protein
VVMGKNEFFYKKKAHGVLCGVKKALEATSWLRLMQLFIWGMSHSSMYYPTTHGIHIKRVSVFHDEEILLWLQSTPRSSPKMLCELNRTFGHSHAKPFCHSSKKKNNICATLHYRRPLPQSFPWFLGLHPWATALKLGEVTRSTPFPYIFLEKKLKALPRGRSENGERKDISFVLFLNVNFIKAKAHRTSWHSAHGEVTDEAWEWRRRRRRVHNVT